MRARLRSLPLLAALAAAFAGTLLVARDARAIGQATGRVTGTVTERRGEDILAFGPSAAAARLEGSKVYSKEFMARHGVPTAAFRVFSEAAEAERYVRERGAPIVVKADGLAAGKGVVVASSVEEAIEAIENMMVHRAFGDAGDRAVLDSKHQNQRLSGLHQHRVRGLLPRNRGATGHFCG